LEELSESLIVAVDNLSTARCWWNYWQLLAFICTFVWK